MKVLALVLVALLAFASLVRADTPPKGTNCHRSCYTNSVDKALSLKKSFFKDCKVDKIVKVQKALRNTYGCAAVIQYRFPKWETLVAYQDCEHANKNYISKLQPYKKSLPSGVLRDFKC